MTLEQTRQLGIEFERRVQTMIPETEYTNKLDTDTIYSYLNQYQDKFVHDIYKQLDGVPGDTKVYAYIETVLHGLLKSDSVTGLTLYPDYHEYQVDMPDDMGLYLNSKTAVNSSYRQKNDSDTNGYLQNKLVSASDYYKYAETPQDSMRIIRQPLASFAQPIGDGKKKRMRVLYDRYTTPRSFVVNYYKIPAHMNLMTSTPCELPIDAFDDLVTGAVDLYVQYVAGAEAKKKQLQEQARKRAREDERDSRRSGGNQDEQQ